MGLGLGVPQVSKETLEPEQLLHPQGGASEVSAIFFKLNARLGSVRLG